MKLSTQSIISWPFSLRQAALRSSCVLLAGLGCGGRGDTETRRDEARTPLVSEDKHGMSKDSGPHAGEQVEMTQRGLRDAGTPAMAALMEPAVPAKSTRLERATGKAVVTVDQPIAETDPVTFSDGGVELGLRVDDLTLLVIFDRSGSMSARWDERSRWQVASDVLMEQAVGPVRDSITVGALLFPQSAECTVEELGHELQFEFMLGEAFIEKWKRNVAINQPGGGTPLSVAFEAADRAIVEASAAGHLEERFRVIVLTDGEPTCGSNSETLTALPAKWRAQGVETVVFGLPGSARAVEILDAIAAAGGTEHHVSSQGDTMEFGREFTKAAR